MKGYSVRPVPVVIAVALLCGLIAAWLYLDDRIGVISPDRLEADIRAAQHIDPGWTVEGSVSDHMAVFVSYPPDQSHDATLSLYCNRPGLSFGYFFAGGGCVLDTEDRIAQYTVEGYPEQAFASSNRMHAARMEINDGDGVQTVSIDSDKPFALLAPADRAVTFYDVDGNIVVTLCNTVI